MYNSRIDLQIMRVPSPPLSTNWDTLAESRERACVYAKCMMPHQREPYYELLLQLEGPVDISDDIYSFMDAHSFSHSEPRAYYSCIACVMELDGVDVTTPALSVPPGNTNAFYNVLLEFFRAEVDADPRLAPPPIKKRQKNAFGITRTAKVPKTDSTASRRNAGAKAILDIDRSTRAVTDGDDADDVENDEGDEEHDASDNDPDVEPTPIVEGYPSVLVDLNGWALDPI
jgi:hypothetical protein